MVFEQILAQVSQQPARRVAVAVARGQGLVEAMVQARERGLAKPVLFGDARELEADAQSAGLRLLPGEIEHYPAPADALRAAVLAVRSGSCAVLVKGHVPTPDFLRAVLDRDAGLRGPGLLTHMAAFELDGLGRTLFLTDSGLNPQPDLAAKQEILRLGIGFLHRLGYERPLVAVLSSSEQADSKVAASRDAFALVEAAAGDALGAAEVAGPFALDLALDAHAAALKGVESPVAGRADLLICPDVVAGNILGKSMLYLAQGRGAGVILGATRPVVMLSRADNADTRLRSLALAIASDAGSLG